MAQAQQTRKDQSLKIYQRIVTKHPGDKANRAKVMAELVAKIGMTPGGASTYYANAKNGNWALTAAPVAKPSAAKAKPAIKAAPKSTAKPMKKADNKKSAAKASKVSKEAPTTH